MNNIGDMFIAGKVCEEQTKRFEWDYHKKVISEQHSWGLWIESLWFSSTGFPTKARKLNLPY